MSGGDGFLLPGGRPEGKGQALSGEVYEINLAPER